MSQSDSTSLSVDVSSPSQADGPTGSSHFRRYRLRWLALATIILAWLSTGLYIVPSDEVAVVSQCGKAERQTNGSLRIHDSGLHFHWPYPLGEIQRVRLFEPRTLTIGSDTGLKSGNFLESFANSDNAKFVSGDKNILHVELTVHYRISRTNLGQWLFDSQAPEARLRSVSEAIVSDVVLRSGVDFVHTLGHATLRQTVQDSLQARTIELELGVDIDDISIGGVNPPVRVKSEFIDVMRARADRETYVHRAKAYQEQQKASAAAGAKKLTNEAKAYELQRFESAKATADSFERLIGQLKQVGDGDRQSYHLARKLMLDRRYLDMLSQVYRNVSSKVFLDSGDKFDITIHRKP